MFLQAFHQDHQGQIAITPEQASSFAKTVAQDFNPIHDVDHKRFCVPGDLLFALTLGKYGLSQKMQFQFEGMVGKGVDLKFPDALSPAFSIKDGNEKQYLSVVCSGDVNQDQTLIEAFVRSYVAFSGLNFMEVLVPLMEEHQVMINAARPLVIYEKMAFDLQHFDFLQPKLALEKAELAINGKRGDVTLFFNIIADGTVVGTGIKSLIMSGLRAYDQEQMNQLIHQYESSKKAA